MIVQVHYTPTVCSWALTCPELENDYYKCWQGLESCFDGSLPGKKVAKPHAEMNLPAVQQEEGPA